MIFKVNNKTHTDMHFNVNYKTFYFTPNISIVFVEIKGKGTYIFPEEIHEEFFELDITPSDQITIEIEGGKINCKEKELILIPPQAKHSACTNIENVYYGASMFINKKILNIKTSLKPIFINDKNRRIEKLFNIIVKDFNIYHQTNDDFVEEIVKLMCYELRKNIFELQVPKIFLEIRGFIKKHYSNQLSLDEIAGSFNLEKHLLIKKFKKFFGISPIAYLINCRLENAIRLLNQNKEQNISEIAFTVGFGDISSFNKHFKKKFSCGPRQYRKK